VDCWCSIGVVVGIVECYSIVDIDFVVVVYCYSDVLRWPHDVTTFVVVVDCCSVLLMPICYSPILFVDRCALVVIDPGTSIPFVVTVGVPILVLLLWYSLMKVIYTFICCIRWQWWSLVLLLCYCDLVLCWYLLLSLFYFDLITFVCYGPYDTFGGRLWYLLLFDDVICCGILFDQLWCRGVIVGGELFLTYLLLLHLRYDTGDVWPDVEFVAALIWSPHWWHADQAP